MAYTNRFIEALRDHPFTLNITIVSDGSTDNSDRKGALSSLSFALNQGKDHEESHAAGYLPIEISRDIAIVYIAGGGNLN